ncbi:MAG: rRNA adenine N-6-methyltransferase family protein [Kiritimatiellae bacterium]|nr:rRNA adenine N-6-methyltransferase family protein [Kiritimatiellia bacterium]
MTREKQNDYSGKDLEAMSIARNCRSWIVNGFGQFLRSDVVEIGPGIGNMSRMIVQHSVNSLTVYERSESMFSQMSNNLSDHNGIVKVNDYFHSAAEKQSDTICISMC